MFVFVDEMGCDRRDAMRKFGYSLLRGRRCAARKLLVRRECVSAISAITLDEILDYQWTTNGLQMVMDFIEHPFDANSVVVMDNAAI